MKSLTLNARALTLCDEIERRAAELRVATTYTTGMTRIIDCGVAAPGGIAAGLMLARVCLSDLAEVRLVVGRPDLWSGPAVQVWTDHPVAACLASQYAGWQLSHEKFFAMGSGPMRAAAGKEELFNDIGHREAAEQVVGVLETGKLPPEEIAAKIAADCGITVDHVTLLAAKTSSIAGTLQVVARSVETALHKLHALKFDLARVTAGFGTAPLPPVAGSDLTAIGWTNDAVLYGGEVTLWVTGDDDTLAEIGPRVPSSASSDYGEPFEAIFARYDRDFYKIDPLLFSPASVKLLNVETGRVHQFGAVDAAVLQRSFSSGGK